MIGFRPNDTDTTEYGIKSEEPAADPIKREVPPDKPGKEIIPPEPSSVPSPQPDTIRSSPAPEITPLPAETPISEPSPEISPIQPVEIS